MSRLFCFVFKLYIKIHNIYFVKCFYQVLDVFWWRSCGLPGSSRASCCLQTMWAILFLNFFITPFQSVILRPHIITFFIINFLFYFLQWKRCGGTLRMRHCSCRWRNIFMSIPTPLLWCFVRGKTPRRCGMASLSPARCSSWMAAWSRSALRWKLIHCGMPDFFVNLILIYHLHQGNSIGSPRAEYSPPIIFIWPDEEYSTQVAHTPWIDFAIISLFTKWQH